MSVCHQDGGKHLDDFICDWSLALYGVSLLNEQLDQHVENTQNRINGAEKAEHLPLID